MTVAALGALHAMAGDGCRTGSTPAVLPGE